MPGPEIPEDVTFSDLDRPVRARLRTLSKDNAEIVGLHLVMAGRLLDTDPELAYEHAQAAVRRGGRVDVVREAAGLAAYRTGRFAEALRELRTVRRLNGSSEHLAVMADCERGLGRPERAIALAASPEAETLEPESRVELAMVVSGARLDMGDPDAALAVLSGLPTGPARSLLAARIAHARGEALRAAGRADEAEAVESAFPADLMARAAGEVDEEDEVVVFDVVDEWDDEDVDADPDAEVDAGAEVDADADADAEVDAEAEAGAGAEAAAGAGPEAEEPHTAEVGPAADADDTTARSTEDA